MKTKILIFYLLLLASNAFAQKFSGIIIYEVKAIAVELKGEKQNKEMVEEIIKQAKDQTFTLEFNRSRSFFYSNLKDMALDERGVMLNKLASIGFTSPFDYYLDKVLNIEYFDRRNGIIIKEKNKPKSWNITTESKLIDTHICYKAIYQYNYTSKRENKTRDVVAWFAPGLPYNYGPKNYNGLPGLILELEDNKVTFLATKIQFSDKEFEINLPKGKTITEEEHEKMIFSN